jgi:hypothetical protein
MLRRLLILFLVALVAAACFDQEGSSSSTTAGAPATTVDGGDGTTTEAPTWTELEGVDDLPQEVQDQLLELVRRTEEIRELKFTEPPTISIVTDDELEQRVRALFEEDADDFPADEALYKLLGMLGPGDDLEQILTDVYGEQVAGFYDGETGELVVPMREDGFSVSQRATMIHELTHAVTDQHFDFDPVMTAMFDEDRLDQASAYQGLIEGDASQAEYLYLLSLDQRELGEFMAEALDIDTSALDAAPEFVQESLIFPYDSGLGFVQSLYNSGGWDSVNEAYVTMPDLPGSTEQILTPSDYGRDLPATVSLAPIDLPGYDLERQSVWGELGFRIMIDQAIGDDVAVDAADGWGGDTYYQWFDGQNAALVIAYVADTPDDMAELEDALVDYAFTAVPEEDYVWVEEIEGKLYFIAADVPDVGLEILDAVGG